ncbi:MAG: hypothetical protein ABEK50_03965 [bacterium]
MIAEETSPSTSEFKLLEEVVRDDAACRVDFDRDDTDSFSLSTEFFNRTHGLEDGLSKTDVLPLLPSGSVWNRIKGWRSFVGIPYQFGDRLWLVLGLMKVREHKTRGAFPVASYYFLDFDSAPLDDILNRIVRNLKPTDQGQNSDKPAYGAVLGDARQPENHTETELWILRRAKAAYARDQRLLFRTAVLSEEEIPSKSYFDFFTPNSSLDESPINFRRSLYSTIPEIYKQFSWQSKLKVFLELDLSFELSS